MDCGIDWLNGLPFEKAREELLKCCGSTTWADRMAARRPFENLDELLAEANRIWWSREAADWLEAFRSHPRIGEKNAERNLSSDAQKWSEREQSGTSNATPDTIRRLSQLNHSYEQKFGYIYIVCAAGKTAEEMLEILEDRMDNAPNDELPIAAAEQAKITELRLKKLLAQ